MKYIEQILTGLAVAFLIAVFTAISVSIRTSQPKKSTFRRVSAKIEAEIQKRPPPDKPSEVETRMKSVATAIENSNCLNFRSLHQRDLRLLNEICEFCAHVQRAFHSMEHSNLIEESQVNMMKYSRTSTESLKTLVNSLCSMYNIVKFSIDEHQNIQRTLRKKNQ